MPVILVAGIIPRDAGKTWTVIALAKALGRRGLKVAVYKPVAGHSAWHQFPTVLESLRRGLLVGEDVVKYERFLRPRHRIELINPIDMLLAPPDPGRFERMDEYLLELENPIPQIVLARVSDCRTGLTRHLLVKANLSRTIPGLRAWIDKLAEKLRPEEVSLASLVALLYSKGTSEMLDHGLRLLMKDSDVVIVESFNDAALPYCSGYLLAKLDAVLAVAPGRIYMLDAEDFRRAVSEGYQRLGDAGLRMSDLMSRSNVSSKLVVPPAPSIEELSRHLERLESLLQPICC